jgi:hypothetical protein
MAEGLRVDGIANMMQTLSRYDKEALAGLREELRAAGQLVQVEAADRFEKYSPKSALGFRTYVRSTGTTVDVEQSIGKTTGLRGDFGVLQMRTALIPSLSDKEAELYASVEAMLEKLEATLV